MVYSKGPIERRRPSRFSPSRAKISEQRLGLGSTGRFGLIRDTEASSPSLDANTTVEKKLSPTSKAELIMVANDALQAIETKGPRCLNKFPPELVRARG